MIKMFYNEAYEVPYLDPVSVAVCLSSPEAGDILHGRPDASSVTMQFSLVHEARNSAAPLISDRTSCI